MDAKALGAKTLGKLDVTMGLKNFLSHFRSSKTAEAQQPQASVPAESDSSKTLMADALYEEAVRFMLKEENDLALVAMHAALFQDSKHVKARCGCGSVLIKLKNFQGAEEEFRRALTVDPLSEMAHVGLGQALAAQGQYREALKVLDKVLRVDPGSFGALFSSALCYADLREWDSAQAAIDLALEGLPGMPLAQIVRARIISKDLRRYNA